MTYQHAITAARVTIAGYPVCAAGVAFTGSESAADMALFGFVPVPPEPAPEPGPPPPYAVSKLALRRALRSAGLEAAFDAALASNPQWAADWRDAQQLQSDDPMFVAALPALAAAAGMSVEQATALMESAAT